MLALLALKLLRKEAEKIASSNDSMFTRNIETGRIALEDLARNVMNVLGIEVKRAKAKEPEKAPTATVQERSYTPQENYAWSKNSLIVKKYIDDWQDWAKTTGLSPRPKLTEEVRAWLGEQEKDLYKGALPLDKFDQVFKLGIFSYNRFTAPKKYIEREWVLMAQRAKEAIQSGAANVSGYHLDQMMHSGEISPNQWKQATILNEWQKEQRTAYQEGKLSPEKAKSLNAMGLKWNEANPSERTRIDLNALKTKSMAAGQLAMAEHGIEDDSFSMVDVARQRG